MTVSATAIFLVNNILSGKTTYLTVVKKKSEIKDQIDYYINQKKLNVDTTK